MGKSTISAIFSYVTNYQRVDSQHEDSGGLLLHRGIRDHPRQGLRGRGARQSAFRHAIDEDAQVQTHDLGENITLVGRNMG